MSDLPSGLFYSPDFISEKLEKEIIDWLDSQEWSTKLSRRTQHYGSEYDYSKKKVSSNSEPLPDFLLKLIKKFPISDDGVFNQCIVNEYTRNQGIAPHTDSKEFGETIIGISLGDDTVMNFTYGDKSYDLLLEKRSCMMMTGDARYKWKHGIDKKVSYHTDDKKIIKAQNYRRISLTFRVV
jgi:alkylated DNA repair dioxygenase AlkB